METTMDSCSTSIARSDTDESKEYGLHENWGRCFEEWAGKVTQGCESDEKSNLYAPIHSPSLRGLPVELWWDILEITNDPRALILATGCTCKTLRDIVREIIEYRTVMCSLDDILSDPTGGYFFSEASIKSAELPSCISTYHTKSLRLQEMSIEDGRLLLRSQTRSALSRLKSVTTLTLEDVHFSTFSDFARTVCALPNLDTLRLQSVTVNDNRSYSLAGVYFARDLRLKSLEIQGCAFGELHPFWKLLTAPALSDSLEHIHAWSSASDPELVKHQLSVPPAALLSASLGRLKRLQFESFYYSCSSEAASSAVLGLLSRSPASRIAAIEIEYMCGHSPPCLHTLEALFTALDSGVAAVNFATLRTICVYLRTKHAFNVDNIRIMVDSQSHSPEWTERLTMSRMVFADNGINKFLSSDEQISETTEAAVETLPREVALEIRLSGGASARSLYTATVVYTRRSETVAF